MLIFSEINITFKDIALKIMKCKVFYADYEFHYYVKYIIIIFQKSLNVDFSEYSNGRYEQLIITPWIYQS